MLLKQAKQSEGSKKELTPTLRHVTSTLCFFKTVLVVGILPIDELVGPHGLHLVRNPSLLCLLDRAH